MKLSKHDDTIDHMAVDATLLYDTRLVPSSESVVSGIEALVQAAGLEKHTEAYNTLISELLILIVKRDDEVFNHAYKAGRQSA